MSLLLVYFCTTFTGKSYGSSCQTFGEIVRNDISLDASTGSLMLQIWSNKENHQDVNKILTTFQIKEESGLKRTDRLLSLFKLKDSLVDS